MSPLSRTSLPPPILYPPQLSQNTSLSSLNHTANPHWLSISHMAVYISPCHSQFIPPSPSPTVPTSQFSMSVKKTQILNAQLRENICMGTPMEAPPK